MITNGFSSSQLSFTVNRAKTGCHVGQLVNVSFPVVFSCVLVDSISSPIHFLLSCHFGQLNEARAVGFIPKWGNFHFGVLWPQAACHMPTLPATPQRRVNSVQAHYNPSGQTQSASSLHNLQAFECLSFLPEDQVYKPLLIKVRDCYV